MVSDVQVTNITVFFPFCFRTFMRKKNLNISRWTSNTCPASAPAEFHVMWSDNLQSKIM